MHNGCDNYIFLLREDLENKYNCMIMPVFVGAQQQFYSQSASDVVSGRKVKLKYLINKVLMTQE